MTAHTKHFVLHLRQTAAVVLPSHPLLIAWELASSALRQGQENKEVFAFADLLICATMHALSTQTHK